jgi:hypothetical protein
MKGESLSWQRIKNKDKDIFSVGNMLRNLEADYVSACARFLSRDPAKDVIWTLKKTENKELSALIINSKSTIIPVFYGIKEIPPPKFLGSFFKLKKIHSIQGLKEEVIILENAMKQFGRNVSDAFDYDLMSLDRDIEKADFKENIPNLVLRVPKMTDLDALAPLQRAYEHEEVLHKGSIFSPAASWINLANIVAGGKILAAEVEGRLVGKINVSGIAFTRYLIGGVYVHPDFRGLGIARQMTAQFISGLLNEGKGITLFVKKSNLAAYNLYKRLGFRLLGDYRIAYY